MGGSDSVGSGAGGGGGVGGVGGVGGGVENGKERELEGEQEQKRK